MATKTNLHPRNLHNEGYDFARLIAALPELGPFTGPNPAGQTTIDFRDVAAVRMLNRALLKADYGIDFWDIPPNYLCPPIPGRVDYIHHLADLLARSNNHEIPRGPQIKALDIGTGASLVYPLTGQSAYGWQFTGVDIDPVAIKSAQQIAKANALDVDLRLQENREDIFDGVIHPQWKGRRRARNGNGRTLAKGAQASSISAGKTPSSGALAARSSSSPAWSTKAARLRGNVCGLRRLCQKRTTCRRCIKS